jgi:DnaJ-class molecular chaperone
MSQDYYQLLGVSKTASQSDIKKAFRKKAHELHPDKGGDAEQFKKVNEAYQVLSDNDKRAQYDRYGAAGPQSGYSGGFGGFDSGFGFNFNGGFSDIFSDLFGAAMANIQAEVEISIPQAVLGDRLELRVGNDKVTLDIPAGVQDGAQMVYRGKGKEYRGGKGDLTIVLRVAIPRRLSKRQKELYEELKKHS